MRFLIQRTAQAQVTVDDNVIGSIGKGYLVLIGVCDSDTEETADLYIRKMLGLRIFEDEAGKTNLSLQDVNGGLLLVSQFTLYANCKKGNRPGFSAAARPELAVPLYESFVAHLRDELGAERVQTGRFGADMKVRLLNDGPFTVELLSASS